MCSSLSNKTRHTLSSASATEFLKYTTCLCDADYTLFPRANDCAMSQSACLTTHPPCLTSVIVSQLDQLADRSQYRPMQWSVLITRRIPLEGIEVLRQNDMGVVSRDNEAPLPRSELLAMARDCDGVIVAGGERIDAEFFNAAPKLKAVSCVAVGYDHVDVAEATRRHIYVTNTP